MATVVNAELVAETPVSVPVEKMPIVYPVTDSAIAQIREKCTGLTCDTKDGYKQVKTAIAGTRKLRVEVEKKRKALKEDALKYGRAVDAEAKRITKLLEDIETPLQKMKDAADEKAERERQEAELAERRRLEAELAEQHRIQREAEDARIKAEREADAARIKAEQEAEARRLADQREAQRIAQEKIDAENARIAEANKKIAEAKAEIEKEKQRIAQEEADRKAKREAEAKAEQEKKEAAERAERERLEAERLAAEQEERERKAAELAEAMRPDREKIHALANEIREFKKGLPLMESLEAGEFVASITLHFEEIARDCERF